MKFPYSPFTHEGKRMESLAQHAPERHAQNIQNSGVYDYAHSVNNFVDSALALTEELEKFGLSYTQVSLFIKKQITHTDLYGETLDLPEELSFDEKELLMEYINKYIESILAAESSLQKVKAVEKDFSLDVKKAIFQTLSIGLSIVPDFWKEVPELAQRMRALQQVIQANPDWWGEWKYKIEIRDDGIEFLDSRVLLDTFDLEGTYGWKDAVKHAGEKQLPNNEILGSIKSFILSAGAENAANLLHFLGLKNEKYWTSSSGGYLLSGMSYHYNMADGVYSYSPQTNQYPIRLVTVL